MRVTLELDVSRFDADCAALEAALDHELAGVVVRAATATAAEARASHSFQNRSRDLEDGTQPVEPGGSFVADTLAGGVVAATDYGEYVDRRMPFLQPAWNVIEPYTELDADYSLARAARTAGWV